MSEAEKNSPLSDAEKEIAAAAAPKPVRQRAVANDDVALLAQYGLAHLPEMFAMQAEGGMVIQEREACYQCSADGFYGRGTHGTWHQEGEILVMDIVPNEHLRPLNRAAGVRYAKWIDSLPQNRVPVDMGDISEAMTMLAARPDFLTLTPEARSEAAMKFAVSLKLRREGKDARDLPSMGHNFAPVSGGSSPPILGAKMSDMTQRGPGFTAAGPGAPAGPSGVRRAQQAPAAIGGLPPGR